MKPPVLADAALRNLEEDAQALAGTIITNRRRIHEQPELGLMLPKTQALVVSELERIGVPIIRTGRTLSSVVADIEGTATGRATRVALRADMDALPLSEHNDLPYASKVAGCMHACGHDAHVAMLLGAAELLMKKRDAFAGTVRLMFQPGEEGFGGARLMIDEGVLEGIESAFALHIDSSTPMHTLSLRKGPIMASADSFRVVFHGAGGHASMPHLTSDPIPAIGPFVDGLSHVAARETDPDDRAVFSVTRVVAGTTLNVVPPTAECYGTIRTLSAKRRRIAHEQLRRVAEGVAASRGLRAEVQVDEGYPPTVNHDAPVELIAQTARALGLRVHEMPSPMMGAEDFSYVLENVPGAIAFLGVRCEGGGPLHSDLMKIDESMLAKGAALHVAAALRMMEG
ncbi:MAG TPA: M20 family metallopeptidase [Candidatus Limnocylindrales bacterium]|nr:M20 family metallopeptidase [Candidatus Limnocylindrales bacterium]